MKVLQINRFIGGILLVAGTTIGAGMLALPVITSFAGFFPSIVLFIVCWTLMLCTALFFLDVNLAVRGEPNLISMAGKTLGNTGKTLSWIFYLLLLYSLTAAYIAASTPLFTEAIRAITGYPMPRWLAHFSLPVIFGSFIYLGTKGVDYVNRILMLGLIFTYFLLVIVVSPHLDCSLFIARFEWSANIIALPVVFTSFGYHIIIPSLSTYLEHNKKLLRQTLIIGSAIPFVVYLIWQLLVIGVVPFEKLQEAFITGEPATVPLSKLLKNPLVGLAASFFSFFAIVTSFLGVALSLSDFLTDGLKIKKTWEGRLLACVLTFLPPLIFVFTCQRGFYLALEHAGAFVAILLGILPCWMAWKLKNVAFYQTTTGKVLLSVIILFSLFVVITDILYSVKF